MLSSVIVIVIISVVVPVVPVTVGRIVIAMPENKPVHLFIIFICSVLPF